METATSSGQRAPLSPASHSEMTPDQREFLSWLIRTYKPRKLVEVGVSSGGTSAHILRNTSRDQILYGVDLSEQWYRDASRLTGWEVEEVCSEEEKRRYRLLAGRDPVQRLDEIGGDIDFLLLDSAHLLPGELIQFLAFFPFLKKGAVVAFHDLNANRPAPPDCSLKHMFVYHGQNASNVAYSSIASGTKILPMKGAPAIGALIVDDETEKNLVSTFMALGITWDYWPGSVVEIYKKHFQSYYNDFCSRLFDHYAANQKRILDQRKERLGL